jgi:hypothetical protein
MNDESKPPHWLTGAPVDPVLLAGNDEFGRGDHARAIALVEPLALAGVVPAQALLGAFLMLKEDQRDRAEHWVRGLDGV